ncbi:farnesol dehydrogenase [Nasonia vitripennis]|uniref:Uncharacterized protein n=1 Tax=Nasonia vitripennis TaxID=7425 RepID=A0A7M7LJI4_NASVI|nr:farnesol dehydrogenase [Nasonia vitripennis]
MYRWAGKVAVITGASSGIGLATAKALVYHGLIVVGLARRKSKMESDMKDVKGDGRFYPLECDISNEKQIDEAFAWVKKNLKSVHILINNAGIQRAGKVTDLSFTELKQIVDINFIGLLYCSKIATTIMKEGGEESHIIMINSVVGHRLSQIPSEHSTNIYPATKFAVRALANILEKESYGGNIRVTNISPGAVKTEMTDKIVEDIPQINQLDFLEAEDIADAIVYVLGTLPRVQIEELVIKPLKAPY